VGRSGNWNSVADNESITFRKRQESANPRSMACLAAIGQFPGAKV